MRLALVLLFFSTGAFAQVVPLTDAERLTLYLDGLDMGWKLATVWAISYGFKLIARAIK